MNILITNDDGIFAPGVEALTETLQHFADVYVCCPDQERSAIGHSITLRNPLKAKPVDIFPKAKAAWCINGTPSDCVKVAMEVLMPEPPDIVFSGINLGPNVGRDIFYSGTMAGAVEASLYQIPSVSVSLHAFNEKDVNYYRTKQILYEVVETILQNSIPKGVILNINLPNVSKDTCKGIVILPLDMSISRYQYVGLNDPHGHVYFWLKDEWEQLYNFDDQSDFKYVKDAYVTISPIEYQFENKRKSDRISRWFRDHPLNIKTRIKEGV
ncbi:5'/3'-nucleotidase SurE [Lederbergia lenta]|uniref:5'-nucleotidase SurE n=1 Tax=Lederbergia lenta TaxID=1467 RepID=A0A2X4ZC14_LEDLE|nr:5'/3'-nucleotidase SurE [Lederbergia lenta]MCM3111763.1 5'/3'-nucleotidase SurE [Lederbergia lenta]MEC2322917.1 5'/3'-nucleotidase SurE [Lederbergia lenta]SQI62035.1 5'-nucleotidase surE [Lederbergia lenta]